MSELFNTYNVEKNKYRGYGNLHLMYKINNKLLKLKSDDKWINSSTKIPINNIIMYNDKILINSNSKEIFTPSIYIYKQTTKAYYRTGEFAYNNKYIYVLLKYQSENQWKDLDLAVFKNEDNIAKNWILKNLGINITKIQYIKEDYILLFEIIMQLCKENNNTTINEIENVYYSKCINEIYDSKVVEYLLMKMLENGNITCESKNNKLGKFYIIKLTEKGILNYNNYINNNK